MGWPAASAAHAWKRGDHIAPNVDLSVRLHRFAPKQPWLLCEAHSPVGAHGLLSAELAVWSSDGLLLGTGGQSMLVRSMSPG